MQCDLIPLVQFKIDKISHNVRTVTVINKLAKEMKRYDDNAFVKRCMWLDLNERIKDGFDNEIKSCTNPSVFGDLYLYSDDAIFIEAKKRKINIITCEVINATYIYSGNKRHEIKYISNGKLTILHERGAQLWYTQEASGTVFVFVSPCSSAMNSFDEKEIIIGRYSQPIAINKSVIKKHINTFLKYRMYTGINSSGTLSSYIYRMYLQALDFRNKKPIVRYVLSFIYKSAILILAAGGIWATLYAAVFLSKG